ncbi:MAG: TetR/AcrR family transcriptional regulator [Clostridia bacterium]|nr:TetR/AcrR family transcriptional regulator [Clostridia bacterium]
MAAVKKFSEEAIIGAALKLIREGGMDALNVRSLAGALGCSTRPVYITFGSMDEVKARAVEQINKAYLGYLKREVESGRYPPYKAYGMAYIRFAREEREFFKYQFMRDRTGESGEEDISEVIAAVMKSTGLDEERAKLFHLESWIFVHGIAAMLATSYFALDEELISMMLTDMFEGLKTRFGSK